MTSDDETPKKTVDELLEDCATDTAAMLALGPSISIPASSSGETPEDVEVVACCARELERLALGGTLRRMPPRRVSDPGPLDPEAWAVDAASVLTLIRTRRYYVATRETSPGTRDVYPVAIEKPVRVPYELRFRNIDRAWSHRAPPTSARSSAPTRSARRARTRVP